jgi:hypothetical protein
MQRQFLLALLLGALATFSVAEPADKVLARWSDGWYVGTVVKKVADGLQVVFDDGDEAVLPASGIRPLDWAAGTRVQCNFKGAGIYYWGVIEERGGVRLSILYDDGDREVTILGRCRVPF